MPVTPDLFRTVEPVVTCPPASPTGHSYTALVWTGTQFEAWLYSDGSPVSLIATWVTTFVDQTTNRWVDVTGSGDWFWMMGTFGGSPVYKWWRVSTDLKEERAPGSVVFPDTGVLLGDRIWGFAGNSGTTSSLEGAIKLTSVAGAFREFVSLAATGMRRGDERNMVALPDRIMVPASVGNGWYFWQEGDPDWTEIAGTVTDAGAGLGSGWLGERPLPSGRGVRLVATGGLSWLATVGTDAQESVSWPSAWNLKPGGGDAVDLRVAPNGDAVIYPAGGTTNLLVRAPVPAASYGASCARPEVTVLPTPGGHQPRSMVPRD